MSDSETETDSDHEQERTGKCLRNVANISHVKPIMLLDTNVFNPKYLKLVIPKAAPKVSKLFEQIAELDAKDMKKHNKHFKHMIFTDIDSSKYGAKLIASAFVANDFTPVFTNTLGLKTDDTLLKTSGKNFGLLLSKTFGKKSMPVKFKKAQMLKYNQRPDNVQGELMRFIILDQGFKEGIDLFDVKYVHLFEPLVSPADQKQAIGRSTRFCGQKGLEFHPRLGWPLYVFRYDVNIPKWLNFSNDTLFELYLANSDIDMSRVIFAAQLEDAVIDAAVDKLLTNEVHTFKIDYLQSAGGRKDMQPPRTFLGKTAMQNYIATNFGMFKYPKVKLENKCIENGGSKAHITFTPTQDFVRHYFQPSSAYKGLLLYHSVGTGKCHAKDTPILMYDGTIKIVQNVKIGDVLMGDDSTPRTVLTLARGTDEMYDIVPNEGDKYTVNSEHILVLKYDPLVENKEDEVILKQYESYEKDIIEIEVQDFLRLPPLLQKDLKGIRKGVEFKEKEVPEDPYFIGLHLTTITTTDKQIPKDYLINSRKKRLRLFAGIIDANNSGHYNINKNNYDVIQESNTLTEGILFLARSLGFAAYSKKFHTCKGGIYNFICISINTNVEYHPNNLLTTKIQAIHVGKGDYYGFTIDGNNRYMLGDFTVTHNTCTAIATATSTFEREGYTILWVTRHTLKADIWKNMYDQICSIDIQERLDNGTLVLPKRNPVPNPKKYVSDKWIEPISYKQFSNLLLKKNKFYQEIVKRNGSTDPLRKTLIVIDEAHKLYATNVAASEKPKVDILEQMIDNSYKVSGKQSCRVLLMTATPYTSDGMEMINLLNLLRPKNQRFPTDYYKFGKKYLKPDGTFSKMGLNNFQNDVSGYVSYLNRSQDARNFAHPILENVHVPLTLSSDQYIEASRHIDNQVTDINEKLKGLRDDKRNEKALISGRKEVEKICKTEVKNNYASAIADAKIVKADSVRECDNAKNKTICKQHANAIFKEESERHKSIMTLAIEKCKPSNDGILENKIRELDDVINKYKNEKDINRQQLKTHISINKGIIQELKELRDEQKSLKLNVKKLTNQLKDMRKKAKQAPASQKEKYKIDIKELNLKLKDEKTPLADIKEQIVRLTLDKKVARFEIGRGAIGDLSQEKALSKCFN